MGTDEKSPNLKPKPVKRNRLPKRISLSAVLHVKVILVPKSELQEDNGEWVHNCPGDGKNAGIIRIAKELDEEEQWWVLRHEMKHMLVDVHDHIEEYPYEGCGEDTPPVPKQE